MLNMWKNNKFLKKQKLKNNLLQKNGIMKNTYLTWNCQNNKKQKHLPDKNTKKNFTIVTIYWKISIICDRNLNNFKKIENWM